MPRLTKKYLEEKYKVEIFKDNVTDDGYKCYIADSINEEDGISAMGFTLKELEEDILNQIDDWED